LRGGDRRDLRPRRRTEDLDLRPPGTDRENLHQGRRHLRGPGHPHPVRGAVAGHVTRRAGSRTRTPRSPPTPPARRRAGGRCPGTWNHGRGRWRGWWRPRPGVALGTIAVAAPEPRRFGGAPAQGFADHELLWGKKIGRASCRERV